MDPGKIVFKGKTNTGKDLIIRYLTLDDIESFLIFFNKISKEKTYISFQGEQLSLEKETEYIKKKIDLFKENKSVHLLGYVNNNLAGSSDIDMSDKIRSHQGVFGIVLAQKYRGEGVGTLLMKAVIKEAIKNIKQLKIITLEVMGNNQIAQKLYRHFGFIECGRIPKGLKYKNKYVDQIMMYKKIR